MISQLNLHGWEIGACERRKKRIEDWVFQVSIISMVKYTTSFQMEKSLQKSLKNWFSFKSVDNANKADDFSLSYLSSIN